MEEWNWEVKNDGFLERTISRCKRNNIILPTFEQLKHPHKIPKDIQEKLKSIGVNKEVITRLPELGISSISNFISAIKLAKYYEMNDKDVIFFH